MASSTDECGARVVIIAGLIYQDIKSAALFLSHFLKLGFQIHSTNLHDGNFLYTLIHPTGLNEHSMTSEDLEMLKKIKKSTVFSVAIQ